MARIAGVDLPSNKRIEVALTYIFGIGLSTSQKILSESKVDPDKRVKDLADEEINDLRKAIEKNTKVEGDLRTEVAMNIKRLMDIGCYRGVRATRDSLSAARRRNKERGCERKKNKNQEKGKEDNTCRPGLYSSHV
jgi:small subunit ribosomal protein S13